MTALTAYLSGAGVVIIYFLVCRLATGSWKIWMLSKGKDGRLSTSLAQVLCWTFAVIFGYIVVYVARARIGDHSPLDNIPRNVFTALGLSAVTMGAAKAITVYSAGSSNAWQSARTKAPLALASRTSAAAKPPKPRLADLFKDDDGVPDVGKTQLMMWTLIAIAIFLVNVVDQVNNILANGPNPQNGGLPDIDTVLMVLSGLSMGTYLGKKLITTSSIQMASLLPSSVTLATAQNANALALYGSGFGDTQGPVGGPKVSYVLVGGYPTIIDSWSDGVITFHLDAAKVSPLKPPAAGVPPPLPVQLAVTVVVAGQPSPSSLPLTVSA